MAPRRRARPGLRRHLLLRSRPLLLLLLPPLLPPPRAASAATPRVFCYVVVATPAEEALAAVHRREGTHRAHCDAITFFGDRRTPLLTPFLPPGAGPGALVTPKGGPAWFGAPVTLNLPVFLALWRHLRDARTLEAGGWDWVVKLDADALLSPGPRGRSGPSSPASTGAMPRSTTPGRGTGWSSPSTTGSPTSAPTTSASPRRTKSRCWTIGR